MNKPPQKIAREALEADRGAPGESTEYYTYRVEVLRGALRQIAALPEQEAPEAEDTSRPAFYQKAALIAAGLAHPTPEAATEHARAWLMVEREGEQPEADDERVLLWDKRESCYVTPDGMRTRRVSDADRIARDVVSRYTQAPDWWAIADLDGWIARTPEEIKAGECPVPGGMVLDVMFDDGERAEEGRAADGWWWRRDWGATITRYRPHVEQKERIMNEEIIEAGPQIAESKMIWSVFTNTDLTEGRGTEYAVYNCTDKTTARRLAQRAGVMGSPAPIKPQIAIKLEGNRFWHVPGLLSKPSAADMKQIEKDERHEKALQAAKDAGLSEETIAILEKGA